jgi:hypothetical protein
VKPHDCARTSEAAVTKWIADRRAKGRVELRVDPRILDTYVGQYQFKTLDNRIFTITREGGRLSFGSTGGSRKSELFAESESTFFLKTRPYVFVFAAPEGQAPQFKIVEGAETYLSKRIK